MEETENEAEEVIPRILLGSKISEEVTDFIQEIVEGEYSTRDLKTIKDIESQYEAVIDENITVRQFKRIELGVTE